MSKSLLCLCLCCVLLILPLLSGCGGEVPEDTSTNLLYISNGDGTCSFAGLMDPDAAPAELRVPRVNYRRETVTGVATAAMYLNSTVQRILLPDTVEEIGESAFHGSSLIDIDLPEHLTVIGKGAFQSCTSLKYVGFGSRVSYIGESAFEGCSALTFVQLPGSLNRIDMFAFMECEKLQAVYVESGVTALGDFMFKSCTSLSEICLPEGLREVGYGTFQNCGKLTSVVFRKGLASLGGSTFESCAMLSSITIPDTVTDLGPSSFADCGFFSEIRYAGTETGYTLVKNAPEGVRTAFGERIPEQPDAETFFGRSRKVNATVPVLCLCAAVCVGFSVFWILRYRKIRAYRKEAEQASGKGAGHGRRR